MSCTESEVDFLMNYAVIDLIQIGSIAVMEQEEEQQVSVIPQGSTLN